MFHDISTEDLKQLLSNVRACIEAGTDSDDLSFEESFEKQLLLEFQTRGYAQDAHGVMQPQA